MYRYIAMQIKMGLLESLWAEHVASGKFIFFCFNKIFRSSLKRMWMKINLDEMLANEKKKKKKIHVHVVTRAIPPPPQ